MILFRTVHIHITLSHHNFCTQTLCNLSYRGTISCIPSWYQPVPRVSNLVTTVSTSPLSAILSQLFPNRHYQPSCHNCFHIAIISHLVTTLSTSSLSAILSQLFSHRHYQPSCHNCFHIAIISHLVTTLSTSPLSAILSQLFPHRHYQPFCHNHFHIAIFFKFVCARILLQRWEWKIRARRRIPLTLTQPTQGPKQP
jgi:hypothetical protein